VREQGDACVVSSAQLLIARAKDGVGCFSRSGQKLITATSVESLTRNQFSESARHFHVEQMRNYEGLAASGSSLNLVNLLVIQTRRLPQAEARASASAFHSNAARTACLSMAALQQYFRRRTIEAWNLS